MGNDERLGKKFLTSEDLAARWKVHVQTLANMRKRGELKAMRLAKGYLFDLDDIVALETFRTK